MVDITSLLANGAQTNANWAGLSQIPDAYFQGQDLKAKNDLRQAFPNGIPQKNGQPDYPAVADTFFKNGAYEQGTTALNLALQQQNLQETRRNAYYSATGREPPPEYGTGPSSPQGQPSAQQTPNVPSMNRSAMKPDAAPLNRGGAAPQGQDNQVTPATFLQSQGVPPGYIMESGLKAIQRAGINPDQTFDPTDPNIKRRLDPVMQRLKGVGQVQMSRPGDNPPQGQPQMVPGPQVAQAPPQAGSTAPIVPTPVATQNIQPQQANPFANAVAAGLIPPGVDPVRYVGSLKFRANSAPKGPGQEGLQKQIDAIYKVSEPTDVMKNAASVQKSIEDFTRSAEETKNDVARFGKQAEGIDASAAAAASMFPHLQLARSLMNQPSFYSGTGEGITLAYKRAIAAFGGDPNASLPQEGYRKVMAANILDQVAQLKAETAASGGSTRIFQSQIALMEKAAQNPDNSIAANRLLTEIGFRAADRAIKIANMANSYNGGHLNPQFNMMLRKWNADNPVFTPEEMADPRIIAPPEFKDSRTAFNAKLPKGTPVKIDGKLKWVQ